MSLNVFDFSTPFTMLTEIESVLIFDLSIGVDLRYLGDEDTFAMPILDKIIVNGEHLATP